MPQYKNVGKSPWRRPAGFGPVPPGGLFDATEREHERIQRRGYQGRLRLCVDPPPVVENPDWPLKMTPSKYLKLHPEGKHAERARQLVAPEGETEDV